MRRLQIISILISLFISGYLFAGICDTCDACKQNAEKIQTMGHLKTVINNYACFEKTPGSSEYEINFEYDDGYEYASFQYPSQMLTIQLNSPSDKLTIKNLNIEVQPGVVVDKVINITHEITMPYHVDSMITLQDSIISGNSGADSSAVWVASYYVTLQNNLFSNFTNGVYVESPYTFVKISQNDFTNISEEPIHLELGANSDIPPIKTIFTEDEDVALWKVMNKDETLISKVVGVAGGIGTVELFKHYDDKISYVDVNCSVNLKEETEYSDIGEIPKNSVVLECLNINEPLETFVGFTFTSTQNNSSILSNFMQLKNLDDMPSAPATTPVGSTIIVETEPKDDDIIDDQYASYFEQTDLDDDDDTDDKTTTNAADGASSVNTGFTCTLDPYATSSGAQILITLLMFLIPIVTIRKIH